jgi:2-methylcitrate dehydratase PrpD
MTWTTYRLAEFSCQLRHEDLVDTTRNMVKCCILDLMAAAAAGVYNPSAAAVREFCRQSFAEGPSSVWFTNTRRHPAAAALANSAAASALDLDDGHRAAGGHPGASIIPAVMALAQRVGASGPEVLSAIAVGYELGVRIAAARDFSKLDTLSTGRWCAYGVAAAGGRLLGLLPEKTAQAMAIAGVLSPGLSAAGYSTVMGNHVKEGIAWATWIGLAALDLAAKGYTGPIDILDHRGYYDADQIVSELGRPLAIDTVYFKPYACCRWIHAALDGILELLSSGNIEARDIRRIKVYTFGRALRLNNYADPDTLEAAQYSIPFCMALAAIRGRQALLPMKLNALHQPEVVSLAAKVLLEVDPDLERAFPDRTPARVVVETAGGCHETSKEFPRGDPANPMGWQDLVEKLRQTAGDALPAERRRAVVESVANLDILGPEPLLNLLGGNASRLLP